MSKSAGNFYTLDQLIEAGFSPADLRYVLISAHYRQPLNFVARDDSGNESFPALAAAKQALQRIAKFDTALANSSVPNGVGSDTEQSWVTDLGGLSRFREVQDLGSFADAFAGLQDDLNTPDALGRVFSAMKAIKPDELSPDEAAKERIGLRFVLTALGLELPDLDAAASVAVPAEIAELAEKRFAAKQEKNWEESDRLRDKISEAGWEIKDTKEGYEVCPKS